MQNKSEVNVLEGIVEQILICRSKGEPMIETPDILAIEGVGLAGDRYATGKGAYETGRNHVSLISIEAIEAANTVLKEPFLASETRRNIVTRNVPLNELVGKEFSIGGARFLGVKLCDPCTRPAVVAGRGSVQGRLFEAALENQGGLNVEVLASGLVKSGDSIYY